MKNRENRLQHFIPQCYLKGFSPNGKFVFVYDKELHKTFHSSIGKIACDVFFYDLPERFIKNYSEIPFGAQYYEKVFFANTVEKIYENLLKKIICAGVAWKKDGKNDKILSEEERKVFAQLVAIQYLRMPDIRVKYSDVHEKRLDCETNNIKAFVKLENPNLKDTIENIQIKYDKEYDPILHSEIFSDEEIILGIANQLIDKHWIFYYSENNDFYTSDNPIIIKPHLTNQSPLYEGFGMRGVEIILPISSSILLTMWDSNYFDNIGKNANTFNVINTKQKREYNSYQYMLSNQQTYSCHNDFNLVKLLIICNNGNEFLKIKSRILINGK